MRLTKKFRNIYVYNFDKNCDFEERKERSIETHNKIIDKCGQLEDIEDELGIDLITLFKAIKNGIYFREKLGGKTYEGHLNGIYISFEDKSLVRRYDVKTSHSNTYFAYYKFEDYGKTWALTKEELL